MKRIIEISAGEGGQDAQLLVADMVTVYTKMCQVQNWKLG
jgi:protein subunit release factor A